MTRSSSWANYPGSITKVVEAVNNKVGDVQSPFWFCETQPGSPPAIQRLLVGGEDDLSVQHALGGQQLVAEVPHFRRRAAQHRHLQTMPLAQVDVQARHDQLV